MKGLRRPVIAANWKMHKIIQDARALAAGVSQGAAGREADVIVCPPFTALAAVRDELAGSTVILGAQNVHWEAKGAFTGEIAPGMLMDAGCGAVIIGHSERREHFGETDEAVARKVKAALEAGLIPIVCVGEGHGEKEAGETEDKVAFQVRAAAGWIASAKEAARLVIAYEPLWAIGTGRHADGPTAGGVARHIRGVLASLFGDGAASKVRILYGGSVNKDNAKEFAEQPDIDGALVGGASLAADSFTAIVDAWLEAAAARGQGERAETS